MKTSKLAENSKDSKLTIDVNNGQKVEGKDTKPQKQLKLNLAYDRESKEHVKEILKESEDGKALEKLNEEQQEQIKEIMPGGEYFETKEIYLKSKDENSQKEQDQNKDDFELNTSIL